MLAGHAEALDAAYREVAVQLDGDTPATVDDDGRLHAAALVAVPDPPSLTDLRRRVEAMLPRIDLPELVLEVMSWHPGFTEAFTHASGNPARVADLGLSVAAVLCAHAMNVGFGLVTSPGVEGLTRDRLHHVDQSYIRFDTLAAANVALVEAQAPGPTSASTGITASICPISAGHTGRCAIPTPRTSREWCSPGGCSALGDHSGRGEPQDDAVLARGGEGVGILAVMTHDPVEPWRGFAGYVHAVCAMQAADRGFADVLTMIFPAAKPLEARRAQAYNGLLELISRAQASGHLRPEFSDRDMVILLMANAGVIAAPDTWQRLVGYMLQSFATPGTELSPLPRHRNHGLSTGRWSVLPVPTWGSGSNRAKNNEYGEGAGGGSGSNC
ncbi:Tn3 family transposase [Nocardia sp. NPDC050799]|uniref:Tn3 family transposase n=1 Tax=Nocardia sp. NPDC050799 TaxID=3154842 RepID=UPI0033EAF362